jgi:biopolymer transport protein ExbB/TolQ
MDTASFTSVVRTLVWIVLIYYGIKFFFKLFGPMIFQAAVKKAGENFQQQFQQQQQYQQQQQQQQTHQAPKQDKPHEKKKVGEYIDYEEIE